MIIQLVLIGVNKKFEGKGFGNIIIKFILSSIFKKIKKLYVVTQGRNIRAQDFIK